MGKESEWQRGTENEKTIGGPDAVGDKDTEENKGRERQKKRDKRQRQRDELICCLVRSHRVTWRNGT